MPKHNTDNKGNLFVMLFAGFLSLLPGDVVEAKPGSTPLPESDNSKQDNFSLSLEFCTANAALLPFAKFQ